MTMEDGGHAKPATSLQELEKLTRDKDWDKIIAAQKAEAGNAKEQAALARRSLIFSTAYSRQGQRVEALQCALRSLAFDPLNPFVMCEIGDLLTGEDPDLAELFMRVAISLKRNPRVVSRVARFAVRTQRASVYDTVREDVAKGEGDLDALTLAASTFDDTETLAKIRDSIDPARALPPNVSYAFAAPQADALSFWNASYGRIGQWLDDHRPERGTSAFFADKAVATATTNAIKERHGDRPLSELHVADVGCGDGYILEHIVKLGVNRAVGIDLSPVALELANKRLRGRAQLVNEDARSWCASAEREGQFDVIVDTFLSHCVETIELDTLVAHYRRLLKPDGLFVMAVSRTNPQKARVYRNRIVMVREKDAQARLVVAGFEANWHSVKDAVVGFARPHGIAAAA